MLSCNVQLVDPSLEVHLLQFWPSGVHHLHGLGLLSSRAMHEEQTKTLWTGFWVALLKLALPFVEQIQNYETTESREGRVPAGGGQHVTAPGFCSVLPSPSSTAVLHLVFHTHERITWPPCTLGRSWLFPLPSVAEPVLVLFARWRTSNLLCLTGLE